MKRIFRNLFFLISLVVLLIFPYFVFAEADPLFVLDYVAQEGGYAGGVDEYSMSKMVGTVIEAVLSMLGVVFTVLLLYGGFKWMKASGREEDVKTAQAIIGNAIIGLILTVSSYSISLFVMSRLLYE